MNFSNQVWIQQKTKYRCAYACKHVILEKQQNLQKNGGSDGPEYNHKVDTVKKNGLCVPAGVNMLYPGKLVSYYI